MSYSRPLSQRIVYRATHVLARLSAVIAYSVRVTGREHVPVEGGVLVCSNHQSFFDPVLVGLASDRPMNYLARKSLFRFSPFRWLILLYDAIPIDREGFSLDGIKETLRRLKRGEMVLIFPEGTRTTTGNMSPLKPGFCSLARRGKCSLLPVGIDGAYQTWPRGQLFPGVGPIQIVIGQPITPEEIAAMPDEALIAELFARMQACYHSAQRVPWQGARPTLLPLAGARTRFDEGKTP